MKWLATGLAVALVALLGYGLVGAGANTTLDDAVRGGARPDAPSRELPTLAGGEASLEDFRGRPVLLNFWASWCEPCKEESPELVAAHERLKRVGGTVLGVTVEDATEDSRRFARENGLNYPSLRDVGGKLGDDFGTNGVPETFLIDRSGRVVDLQRGSVDARYLERALPKVLG